MFALLTTYKSVIYTLIFLYIISLLKTKDYKTIIKNICKEKDSIFIFTSGNDKKRYVSKERLYKEAKKYLNDVNMYKYELKDAINICKKAYNRTKNRYNACKHRSGFLYL